MAINDASHRIRYYFSVECTFLYILIIVLMHEKGGVNVHQKGNQGDIRESLNVVFKGTLQKCETIAPPEIFGGEVSQISTI